MAVRIQQHLKPFTWKSYITTTLICCIGLGLIAAISYGVVLVFTNEETSDAVRIFVMVATITVSTKYSQPLVVVCNKLIFEVLAILLRKINLWKSFSHAVWYANQPFSKTVEPDTHNELKRMADALMVIAKKHPLFDALDQLQRDNAEQIDMNKQPDGKVAKYHAEFE